MPSGRPSKNGKQMQFRTVAIPLEVYDKILDLAEEEQRSIARQLAIVITKAHDHYFREED
jgi:hypothetical protein|tara:strand:- start:2057 stop:2236 length:180 start_codon:yes stop_codon:yes gene_type:complete